MKKSSVLAAALLLTFASAVMAADKAEVAPGEAAAGCCACPADPTVTGDVYIGPSSKYLFRGNNLSTTGDFVIQGGIDLTYKAFTLSYWGNAQNRYSDGTYSRAKVNETDLIIDYSVPYTIPGLDNLKFNVGTQYFAVDGINDTNELYLKAAYDTILKPTLTVYWDTMLASKTGLFYTAAVSQKIPLERNVFALNLGALASYNQRNPNAAYTDEGDGVYSDWHNYELSASLDYTPTANITISPSYLYSNALSSNAKNIGIKEQHAYGFKVMFGF